MWLSKWLTITTKVPKNKLSVEKIDKAIKIADSVKMPDSSEFACVDSLPGFLRTKIKNKKTQ
jgi:hypothetical protein